MPTEFLQSPGASLARYEYLRSKSQPRGRRIARAVALTLGLFLLLVGFHRVGERIEGLPYIVTEGLLFAIAVSVAYWVFHRQARRDIAHYAERLVEHIEALNSTAIVAVTDASGRILDVNDMFCRISGYSTEELVGGTHNILNSGHHPRQFFKEMYRTIASGKIWRGDICNRAKDGSIYWVDTTIVPARDEHGRIARFTAIRIDITARKLAEENIARLTEQQVRDLQAQQFANERVRQSDALLKTIIDVLPERIFWKDGDGRFLGCNRAFREDAGRDDIVGKFDRDMPWAAQADLHRERDLHVMQTRESVINFVEQQTYADGSVGWVSRSKSPLIDSSGEVRGIVGSYLDITAIKQAEVELRRTRDAAESASRAKSDFLAVMSHEIRTPMNAVLGFTDFLLDTPLNAEQRDFAATIRDSGRSLLGIIDDILDFSKMEAGRLAVAREPFDARLVASEAMALLGSKAAAKGLQHSFDWSARNAMLVGDAGRFRQVMLNLFGNAIKFTKTGSIAVRATSEASQVRIEVIDTGIGIAAADLGKLFTKFTQADSSTTRKYGGTGLGLAISRQLVELMGGTIGVRSEPGSGSTFWFTMPVAKADVVPLPVAPAPAGDEPRRRVLVVDDNVVNGIVAKRMLEKLNCEVQVVRSGEEAQARVLDAAFDAIFMDCEMPELDGYEATRRIRRAEAEQGRRTPIIALSASVLPEDKSRCMAAGMDAHLPKPVIAADLRQALQHWCATAKSA